MIVQRSLFGEAVVVEEQPKVETKPAAKVKALTAERLSERVLGVLRRCRVEGDRVYLPNYDLGRSLYEEVNEVLTRLRGKWKGGKTRAHLFPYDVTELMAAVISSGLMPAKNPTAFFATQPKTIDLWFELGGLSPYHTFDYILEPSAGMGAVARRLREMYPKATLHVCELDGINRAALNDQGFEIEAEDFLSYEPEGLYDLIVMNPPFSVAGDNQAYITHTLRAWEMLAPCGKLLGIAPLSWTYADDRVSLAFRKLVFDFGDWERLPAESFKASGTGVETTAVWLEKPADGVAWRRRPYQGFNSHHSWEAMLWLENEHDLCERYNRIIEKLAKGAYRLDLAGIPMNPARSQLESLFAEAAKEGNRTDGDILLETEDIEFLLMYAGSDAREMAVDFMDEVDDVNA